MQDHAWYFCAENKFSPGNKTGGKGGVIKLGSVAEEIKSYFCMSEPYNVNAGRAMFSMKKSVDDGSHQVHVPFCLGSACL